MTEPTWWDYEDDDWTVEQEAVAEAWLFGGIEEWDCD